MFNFLLLPNCVTCPPARALTSCTWYINARFIDEIKAHAQKVTCLDLGVTGRVMVTGGQDMNVNLWTFGNDTCFMVRIAVHEKKKNSSLNTTFFVVVVARPQWSNSLR